MKRIQSWPFRIGLFVVYALMVCLLSGWLAISLRYPSLFNVYPTFAEYAVPAPFSWAFAHIPFLFLFGVPLLLHGSFSRSHIRVFRWFCVIVFVLLLLEFDNKIPFFLFPKVDAVMALIFSLILVPPKRAEQPVLHGVTLAGVVCLAAAGAFWSYDTWRHATPTIRTSAYLDNTFLLRNITVSTTRHTLEFELELLAELSDDDVCDAAQQLASDLLSDYPYDREYDQSVRLVSNRAASGDPDRYLNIGEISLDNDDKAPDGQFACYVRQ